MRGLLLTLFLHAVVDVALEVEVARALAQATQNTTAPPRIVLTGYVWRRINDQQSALLRTHKIGSRTFEVQIGAWHHGHKVYREYSQYGDYWGRYVVPPIPPPPPNLPGARQAAPVSPTPLSGPARQLFTRAASC